MTAVTIKFEDTLFTHLKQKANSIGYSLDNYILHLLTKNLEATEKEQNENIDDLLDSMQFHGGSIPATDNGKGNLAEVKFM